MAKPKIIQQFDAVSGHEHSGAPYDAPLIGTTGIQGRAITTGLLANPPAYGFKNLLDPSKQSFSRASNATRKDLTPIPYNVLRTEQGRYGQGAFIEESTTNLVYNSDFETITGTTMVFSDAMTAGTTADPAWTVQSGSFTWSTSGATSGANGAYIIAGNNAWKPLTGSNGTALALTVQSTFTTPSPIVIDGTYGNGTLILQVDPNNRYRCTLTDNSFTLSKTVSGTYTQIATVSVAPTASTTYTITLSITPSGQLTAKLYSGVGTGGTLLQTLTATDTSLTGGFLIGVGGDTGVVIKNAQVTAPFADAWSVAGDQRVAWALTSTNPISGNYSVSAVGISGVTGSINNVVSGGNISAGQTAAYSVFVNGQGVGSGKASLLATATGGTATTSSVSTPTGTFSTQRIQGTLTAGTGNTGVYATLNMNDVGTVIFDCVQIEIKNYPTTYVRNDSTSASATRNADSLSYTLSNPLPSRYFGALVWTPEQASGVALANGNDDRTLLYARSRDNQHWRYLVGYYPADSTLRFYKYDMGGTTISVSVPVTFNAHDRISIFFEDDPTTAQQINLWVGVNNGSLSNANSASTTSITDVQGIDIGCRTITGNAGFEANGTIDFPILTDIIPTADQVQALYQASDWGGDRNYPGVLPEKVSIGNKSLFINSNLADMSTDIDNPNRAIMLTAKEGAYIGSNIYWDGANWRNHSINSPSTLISPSYTTGGVTLNTAPKQNLPDQVLSLSTFNMLLALSGGYKVQSGAGSIVVATAGTAVSQTVTFPTSFTSTPIVYVTIQSTSINSNTYINAFPNTQSSSLFSLLANSGLAQTIYFNWIAIGS